MTKRKLKILSLFDGMSCGQLALRKAGFDDYDYHASEIDKYAIATSKANFKNMIHLGDVQNLLKDHKFKEGQFDLIMAGSPCQGFSRGSSKKLNFDDPRSKLFWEFKKILDVVKPRYFFLENVKMNQESQDIISDALGHEPIEINSNLLTAQNRVRLYWTNIPLSPINDAGVTLRDILEDNPAPKYMPSLELMSKYNGGDQLNPDYKSQCNTIHDLKGKHPTVCAGTHGYANGYIPIEKPNTELKSGLIKVGTASNINGHDLLKRVYSAEGKSPTLTTMTGGNQFPKIALNSGAIRGRYNDAGEIVQTLEVNNRNKSNCLTTVQKENVVTSLPKGNYQPAPLHLFRKLTPLEWQRLQGVPDDYDFAGASDSQKYKQLGNGWTVPVIAKFFENLD